MTMAVKRLLDSFHELSEPEGHGLVVEILRRTVYDVASLPDDDLLMTAEALFQIWMGGKPRASSVAVEGGERRSG
ncbi:MAG: hypothetical protein ACLQPD_18920 [Desulfomonilaceae bacterium]